jgi:3-deoxy-D-manno-octulosonate 8-phosphate phosphatase (KDO 8-P phosphatase)
MRKRIKNQKKPKLIFTDFDGCLTDDRVWLNEEGEEFVAANRKDGLAVKELTKLGIKVVIASTEKNKVVTARAKKMGIDVLQGLDNKVEAIEIYLDKFNFKWSDTWYIGNDVNDLEALGLAKFRICPKDATRMVKKRVDLILKTKGGYGILSELASILQRRNYV